MVGNKLSQKYFYIMSVLFIGVVGLVVMLRTQLLNVNWLYKARIRCLGEDPGSAIPAWRKIRDDAIHQSAIREV